jgi:hypothetical protein
VVNKGLCYNITLHIYTLSDWPWLQL